jgi:hypothetical protein
MNLRPVLRSRRGLPTGLSGGVSVTVGRAMCRYTAGGATIERRDASWRKQATAPGALTRRTGRLHRRGAIVLQLDVLGVSFRAVQPHKPNITPGLLLITVSSGARAISAAHSRSSPGLRVELHGFPRPTSTRCHRLTLGDQLRYQPVD